MSRRRKIWVALAVVVVLLAGLRLALPNLLRDEINRRGQDMGEYRTHVEDVSLHLWRGAYSIHGVLIEKKSGKVPVPLAQIKTIESSVSGKALLSGGIVSKMHFIEPVLSFIDGAGKADSQSGRGVNWLAQLEGILLSGILPSELDEMHISRGTVHFRNFLARPQVNLVATDVEATVVNLTNVRSEREARPAELKATANILNGAPLEAHARFDPHAEFREFGFDLRIQRIRLTELNDFFQAYALLDVESGEGEIVMQLETRDGRVSGYAKPLFRDIKIVDFKDAENPLRLAWEALAGTLVAIFTNQSKDQFATRIEFEGTVADPKIDAMDALLGILRNAFGKALSPAFEKIKDD